MRQKIIAVLFILFLCNAAWATNKNTERKSKDRVNINIENMLLKLPDGLGSAYWSRLERISYLRGQLAKFRPVSIKYDRSSLSSGERRVVDKLIEASRYINKIFLNQAYSRNGEIERSLKRSHDPLLKLTLHFFDINFGPFDRINNFFPFYGNLDHPPGANFYPGDLTREDFESWLKEHPGDTEALTSDLTVIRRKGDNLVAVPYSREYESLLIPASKKLEEAAGLTENESFKKFLLLRAKAFLSNDYFDSDLAWVDVRDSRIEAVIGPYEVYEDKLFNFKASFESFVVINIPREAEKFVKYVKYLKSMESNLPIDDKYKCLDREFSSPIRIVNEVYSAGDARAGIHTSAFALPNDERVRKLKGCKKMMLKNIMEAKFNGSTIFIAKKAISPDQLAYTTFDAYFRDTVFHELSHGLGPRVVRFPDGSTMEADILG